MSDIDLSRVHLIGIGGAGMSGVARILLSRGKVVSGSDVKESRPVLALQSMGAHVAVGHKAENLTLSGQLPTVVVTSFAAIPQDNPELVAAREQNIPVIRRSDLLGELMTGSTQVLIAGTHGKTSTTSMAVVAMQAAGMDPSFAIGGQLNKAGTNAHQGSGHCFVAEADESDASLLRYSPDIAVVTNIEPDHLDFFHTPEAYFQVFDDFASRLTDTGVLVVCLDDEHAAALGERQKTKVTVRGYGSAAAAERHPDIAYTVVESVAVADQISHAHMRVGEREVEVAMQIPGTHMVLNAAAALTAGVLAGGDVAAWPGDFRVFRGAPPVRIPRCRRRRGLSGRGGVRRLRPPSDRGAGSADRGPGEAGGPGIGAGDCGVSAAHVFPHAGVCGRVRRSVVAGGCRGGVGHLWCPGAAARRYYLAVDY